MTSATHRARSLAAALRHVRTRAKVSVREVAARLGIHHTTVSRWETGAIVPSVENVAAYLAVIGVIGDEKDRILALARARDEADWLISGPPGISPQLASVMDYERTAARITEWAPLVVPGLLQTSAYAAAIIGRSSSTISPGEVEARVMVRNARRDALTRLDPVELHALIGVPALRGGIGGPTVMVDQLRHLVDMAGRDNVTIQAYDLGGEWTPAHAGQFILYQFDDLSPAVYLEHHRSGATLVDEGEVAAYQLAAETIRREAMSPEDTARLIADVIPTMEITT